MKIKSLEIQEDLINHSHDLFSEKRNLIHSKKNSRGKSTFLRLLFYSLGYQIPNMKGMNFSDIQTTIILEEKDKVFVIKRHGVVLDVILKDGALITYSLPSQHNAFLSYIFSYEKTNVLKNILGVIYIDQDKGWSLLNRGKVIGQIKFSIEELLAGLNDKDISVILNNMKELTINKTRYETVLNMQQLQEQIYKNNSEIFVSNEEQEYVNKISFEKLKLANFEKSLREINAIINEEKMFFDYIDSMRLFVKHGEEKIPVNRDTLDNSFFLNESLIARKSILVTDIECQRKKINILESKLSEYKIKSKNVLFELPDIEKEIAQQIVRSTFTVDQNTILNFTTVQNVYANEKHV